MTTIYIVTGYEPQRFGHNMPEDQGEILGVCLTPEAAETVRTQGLTRRSWHPSGRPEFAEVTVTLWSGEGPILTEQGSPG